MVSAMERKAMHDLINWKNKKIENHYFYMEQDKLEKHI